jgi:hypothetical protein
VSGNPLNLEFRKFGVVPAEMKRFDVFCAAVFYSKLSQGSVSVKLDGSV